jgi:catechol 2,3-dioxygenase-like lactoylglutathione lyase family enzyme
MPEEKKHFQKRKVNLRFLYSMCNDVQAVKVFYTDMLGLFELGFMDQEGFGWVGYDCEGMQLMFFKWDEKIPVREKWDWQPGDGAGDQPGMSFSIELPEDEAKPTLTRLRESGVESMSDKPTWRQASYWGWTVRDPAGNTVEVYWHPKEKPAEGEEPQWVD